MIALRVFIHALQSLIALAVIGCSATKLSHESSSGFALAIFTAVATILVAIYIMTTSLIAKAFYKVWTAVASNGLTLIFWVATVGVLGAHHSGGCGGYKHDDCYRKRYEKGTDSLWAATLALSVLDGILSIVAVFACYLRKTRAKDTASC